MYINYEILSSECRRFKLMTSLKVAIGYAIILVLCSIRRQQDTKNN